MMNRRVALLAAVAILGLALLAPRVSRAQSPPPEADWQFAASGDSRNCGDVLMPAIAAQVLEKHAAFFWHLGDFRRIYDFDEDMQHQPEHRAAPMTIGDYEDQAWDDFLKNQIAPFGALPVFLGIGNHETIPPKYRSDYVAQFADWLDAPVLQAQRLADNPNDHLLKTYYHWIERGVDFVFLDNATLDQFDERQVGWLERVLGRAKASPSIRAIVVGMHRALPENISMGHGMNESPTGTASGRLVYEDLLKAQNEAHKHVYVLASHSHYYMAGIFDTDYWRSNGGVLPGWIIGTAGATRYPLPPGLSRAKAAETNVYGYLLATVQPDGEIRFDFQRLKESDVPGATTSRYTPEFVHWCFAENTAQ
jgi:hypothetical protein